MLNFPEQETFLSGIILPILAGFALMMASTLPLAFIRDESKRILGFFIICPIGCIIPLMWPGKVNPVGYSFVM
jgi:hypothetical protein